MSIKTQSHLLMMLCTVCILGLVIRPAIAADCGDDDLIGDEIVLELNPGTSIETIVDLFNVTPVESVPQWLIWKVRVAEGDDVETVIQAIEDYDNNQADIVERVESHPIMETPEGVQRSIPDLGQTFTPFEFHNQEAGSLIHVEEAQSAFTGEGVIVAVLDTGMALDHPETANQILAPGADFAGGNGTAEAQPNFIDDDQDGDVDEGLHHGTFVAGLIHLVAPDAKILPVRVLDAESNGDAFDVAKGILYAIEHNADVINLSLGLALDSRVVERAIEDAEDRGVIVIAAAGNRSKLCVDFPADLPETLAVAAVDSAFVKTDFSSYGPQVDLSAPALNVLSTFADEEGNDIFIQWSGTSFATPLVTGGVALLKQKYPGLTTVELRAHLIEAVQPDNNLPEFDGLMGVGVLQLEAMVQMLASDRTSVKVHRSPQGTVLSWSPVRDATVYDVARGDAANLAPGEEVVFLGPLTCISDDQVETDTTLTPDPELPAPGEVFFYVFRDDAPDGGSYGVDSDGHPRLVGASDCPAGG